MKSLNEITVNIPTLNEENNILNCINSVKKSGIKKIIVIDGGSTDKTLKLIKKKNITYYIAKKKGLAFQRALGIKKSKTKYIALIDADHRPLKSSFLKMLNDLDKFDYVAVQPIIVSKKKNMNYFEKSYQKLCDINVNIKGAKKMIGMPALWRSSIIKKNNFNIKITAGSDDTDLSYRLSKKGYVFGGSSAIIYNVHRPSFLQYVKKYLWYGKGDAQFILIHPNKIFSILKHQLFNYPIKYPLISLLKFDIFPIPFMITAGYLRFIGMVLEFIRRILGLKDKIYST